MGLDLGTSGVRALAVTPSGEVAAEAAHGYPLLTPKPGWTEQRPADWVGKTLETLCDIALELRGREILALGLSGQMHGMVPLDAAGQVVRNALLWNDQRTGEAVKEMLERVPREVYIHRTGNPPVTGFHVCKLLWLRCEEPDNFERTRHSLLPKDYLGYVLTGEMRSEPSDNSGTNCFHLPSKTWDEEILDALDLPRSLFPEVAPSHAVSGHLTAEVARQTGLPQGLPVVAGAGDNAAAAAGLGLSSRTMGQGSVSLGTSGVIFAPLETPTPDPEGRVHLFCHADGGYHLLGVTLSAAGSLQWFHDTFTPDLSFQALDRLAGQSRPGANGVTFKPYLSGERTPHLNPALRGSFTGLSLASTRADLVRAVLEGVAFSLRDALDIIGPLAPLTNALATGGGSKSELWLQMVADVLGLSLSVPERNQGAAYGAALLALQGVGAVQDATGVAEQGGARTVSPQAADAYQAALAAYRAVPLQ